MLILNALLIIGLDHYKPVQKPNNDFEGVILFENPKVKLMFGYNFFEIFFEKCMKALVNNILFALCETIPALFLLNVFQQTNH
jgi:hypothetical protein